ncbi:four-carbon acid sugar kinase family protein [Streptomyces europaeiscabiei]|uniref:Four-carbon acid sugar kinase family protein n=1 Tax=Streptomyces europaeiscabiei TaxID=146819 RepID=A0ABU4NSU4_9ACTN|nr:four-carbon acid sugar kinase family protein [Streptomyces europaeiscabiei]MDX3548316.1 four-carbon acid sugar kinase family protein [Streptomyces europaeiscabiei]MDX3558876.1 four-carbon acid sugar kinase family protein [Streptomyces europaeiscabiei]MDX3671929.1 four-carbon acid sugar kinase family protein [Streptomyces europaeiscabiei]MDX3705819.1 four-carbon acid sugar kinase family protein [Streptomyces europaeiscabiei]MDX3716268.1 four-carbon acid sugar kinase family protein [Streptomy
MTSRNGVRQEIVILADDLTSAGDGAGPFRQAGHDARILLTTPASVPRHAVGVSAVDLGSRVLDEEAAASRTWRAARLFAGSELLFKTVDSTLRGHVTAEVRAAWAGSGRRAVVIAPAFPAEGRVTVEGVQYVRGVPVHKSDYARDPVHPVRCSDLTMLFPKAVLALPDRAAELPELIENGDLIVCSATEDGDLDSLVAAVPRLDDVLWVGSPGLAAALARRCARATGSTASLPARARRPLIVVGSTNPATRRQLATLHTRADAQGVTVSADPAPAVETLRDLTAPILTLQTPDERHTPQTAQVLARSQAAVVKALTEDHTVDALVITGGETATTVLQPLGATGIDLLDEPEPGVVRGSLTGSLPLSVLIKAGGFGDDALLLRLCHLIRQRPDPGEHT